MQDPLLLPIPRSLERISGIHTLSGDKLIALEGPEPQALYFTGERLQEAILDNTSYSWELHSSLSIPDEDIGITLRVRQGPTDQQEGYKLSITPDRLEAEASTEAGLFYATCTLIQLIEQFGTQLPCLEITDWPDFPNRGVMLDISRDKVPTMETLLSLIDMLASWKVNQVQLYTEHTFSYRNHPEVWAEASPITGEEILEIDAFCRERFIELVPNQNSFGHMEHWLKHPRYAPLAEVSGTYTTPWGTSSEPTLITPVDPGSLELVNSLYDELIPHFSSHQINVGCDETHELGQGRSKEECERRGVGRVYLDFILKLYDSVKARNRKMMYWGDIIIGYPDLIPELPSDAVTLEWGYDANHPFADHAAQFGSSGIPFYVCPGTSSWCSLSGRTANALGNLRNAAENGLKHGATGFLNTDWGDRGHWQVLPVSYLGFAVGAAYSWAMDANKDMDVQNTVSAHAFQDRTGTMGRIAYELGSVGDSLGAVVPNGNQFFWALQTSLKSPGQRVLDRDGSLKLENARELIDQIVEPLDQAAMTRTDAGLIKREYLNTARLLKHAASRLELITGKGQPDMEGMYTELEGIIEEYRSIWLARNRPGGLADSTRLLEAALSDYQA